MDNLKTKNILNRILIMLIAMIGILLIRSGTALADTEGYYIGSSEAAKGSGYEQIKKEDNSNLEVTLDITQRLDKMIYYILTYEEYENKTYVGNSDYLKLKERKQSALYYLIYNYKQQTENFSNLTTNDNLKNILSNYAGKGNNLSEFDNLNKNGAQIIYALAESWAKGDDVSKEALKYKANYNAISNENIKYWTTAKEVPVEGGIYSPSAEETTLILSIYKPKAENKTAQNAIKVVDQEIVQEKVEMLKGLLDGATSRVRPNVNVITRSYWRST